jgi:cell wall-associated NlpC family hydrolase
LASLSKWRGIEGEALGSFWIDFRYITMMKVVYLFVVILFLAIAWYHLDKRSTDRTIGNSDSINNAPKNISDTLKGDSPIKDTGLLILPNNAPPINDTLPGQIATGKIHPEAVVAFAETLIGTPYLYASTDPKTGFDCSGYITYVFNHFQIKVPRSTIDFTNVGKEISVEDAKRGDIILFTGTDSTERFVGHMGIIISNANGELQFIHSSSGKAHGVTVSPLKGYYMGRFVKVIRIFRSL